jgi:hypothetical protein
VKARPDEAGGGGAGILPLSAATRHCVRFWTHSRAQRFDGLGSRCWISRARPQRAHAVRVKRCSSISFHADERDVYGPQTADLYADSHRRSLSVNGRDSSIALNGNVAGLSFDFLIRQAACNEVEYFEFSCTQGIRRWSRNVERHRRTSWIVDIVESWQQSVDMGHFRSGDVA